MERLQGRVTGLHHERRVVGRPRDGRPAAAVHVYRFELEGRRLELRHGAALPINDGDDVVAVRGGWRSPARVYAWHNRTRGATLVEPAGPAAAMRGWLPTLPAAVLIALTVLLAGEGATAAGLVGAGLAALGAGAFALLGLRGFVEYARYRLAARLL